MTPRELFEPSEGIYSWIQESVEEGAGLTLSVNGDCMDPIIRNGDRVRVEKRSRYRVGDILACHSSAYPRGIAHRFLGYVKGPDGTRLITMSDHASRPDILLKPDDVLGKVVSVNSKAISGISFSDRAQYIFKWIFWYLKLGSASLGRSLKLSS